MLTRDRCAADRQSVAVQQHAGAVGNDGPTIAQRAKDLAGSERERGAADHVDGRPSTQCGGVVGIERAAVDVHDIVAIHSACRRTERQDAQIALADGAGRTLVVQRAENQVPTPLPLSATSKVGFPVSNTPPLLPNVRL